MLLSPLPPHLALCISQAWKRAKISTHWGNESRNPPLRRHMPKECHDDQRVPTRTCTQNLAFFGNPGTLWGNEEGKSPFLWTHAPKNARTTKECQQKQGYRTWHSSRGWHSSRRPDCRP